MRKMATLRHIDSIRPIDGADAIECAIVGGWSVVVKRGEFFPGELAVYAEVDSWIPNTIAPFLSKGNEPREYMGVKGERLRTVKLRGQVSQGLLLKLDTVDNAALSFNGITFPCIPGLDVSEHLGIQKYDPPVPAQLAGQVKGLFPSFIPKTDQERIQNLTDQLDTWKDNDSFTWEITEKLDGSSMTVYVRDDEEGVCSRNLDLHRDESNSLWVVAIREKLIEKIRSTGRNLALQGEIIGEGIQKNLYKVKGQQFRLFDIYDIDNGEYLTPFDRRVFADTQSIDHVPVLAKEYVITGFAQDLLIMAEGKSELFAQTEREGLVFKCTTFGGPTFKSISNKFLLKNGD